MSSNDKDGGVVQCDEGDASSGSESGDNGEYEDYLAVDAADKGMAEFVASVGVMQKAWVGFNKKRKIAKNKSLLHYQKQVRYTGSVVIPIAWELREVLHGKLYGMARESFSQEIAARRVGGVRRDLDGAIFVLAPEEGGKRKADVSPEVGGGAAADDTEEMVGEGIVFVEPVVGGKKPRVVHNEYDGFTPAEVDVLLQRVGEEDSVRYQYPVEVHHPVPPAYQAMAGSEVPCLVKMSQGRWFERGDVMVMRDKRSDGKWRHELSYGDVMALEERGKGIRRVYVFKEQRMFCQVVDDDGAVTSKRKNSKELRPWDGESDVVGCAPQYCPRSRPHVVGQDRDWEVVGVEGTVGVQAGGGAHDEMVGPRAAGSVAEPSSAGGAPHVGGGVVGMVE